MDILENVLLKPYTTFKIGGPAEYFCQPQNLEEIQEAINFSKDRNLSIFLLGGGSNMLVSDNGIKGLVIQPNLKGVEIVSETETEVLIEIAAGENWDDFVKFVVSKNWWGIENLSYVPGLAGAFAVQNVGAYGQEASDVVEKVEAYNIEKNEVIVFTNSDCGFYYRHSIFNTSSKGKFIILKTQIKLSKIPKPNLSYPDLQKRFGSIENIDIKKIREAVIEIRNRKYPFPIEAKDGNAGSFFQNPILTELEQGELKIKIRDNFSEEVQNRFIQEEEKFKSRKVGLKISAFLIDICGLKGKVIGGAKVNENQPLVVLNTGTANSGDVMNLAQFVRQEVYTKTGVKVPIEPELVGFSEGEINEYLKLS